MQRKVSVSPLAVTSMGSLAAVPAEAVECPIKCQDCRGSPWPRVAMHSLWLLEQVNKTCVQVNLTKQVTFHPKIKRNENEAFFFFTV